MTNVQECIKNCDYSYRGIKTQQFEQLLSDYIEAYVVCTNTGSAALQLCIEVLNSYNEYIYTPAISYIATTNAIIHTGNKPYFVDCKKDDLTINIEQLPDMYYDKLIVVWPLGYPPEMSELKQYEIRIIEDSCQALGSFYEGQHAGTIGECGAISFNGNKILSTGGGGAFVTTSRDLYEKAMHMSMQCRIPGDRAEHDGIGHNFRMPALNAALGLDQWEANKDFFINQKEVSKRKKVVHNKWMMQHPDGQPIWKAHHLLEPYKDFPRMDLEGAEWISENVRIK